MADPALQTTVETTGPEGTERAGADLAAALRPGDVVALRGDLGAGKTTFVRGACRALGVTGPVTSPTFTIGSIHVGEGIEIGHLDLHRLGDLAAEDPALLDDHLGGDRIGFVEWPEAAGAELGATYEVRLEHLGGDRRRITWTRSRATP